MPSGLLVETQYFNQDGTFYGWGDFISVHTAEEPIDVFWKEAQGMIEFGYNPGLGNDKTEYIRLVKVAAHPDKKNRRLIFPKGMLADQKQDELQRNIPT